MQSTPHLEGNFRRGLGRRVSALLMHSKSPASIIQVKHAGRLIQRAPQALERQLAVRGVDADDPPAERRRCIGHLS